MVEGERKAKPGDTGEKVFGTQDQKGKPLGHNVVVTLSQKLRVVR
jgi:hypothetical protein